MRKLWLVVLSLSLLIVVTPEAEAQMNRKSIKKNNKRIASYRGRKSSFGKEKKYNSVGLSLNAVNYYGDLAPRPQRISTDISFTRPGFGLSFVHRFGPRYSVKGEFMYATIKGSDADSADPGDLENGIFRYQRNLSFRNRIKELSVVAIFDLFENQSTYISRVRWTPYAFLGVAGFHHNPQAQAPATDLNGNPLAEAGQWVDLRPLGTEGQYADLQPTAVNSGIEPYKQIQIAIPFGIGARFRLNEVMDLSADIAFRYTFTDYLDDVSQNYVDLDRLSSPLAQAMSYRTNELAGYPTSPTASTVAGVNVQNGYGSEFRDNLRGSKSDRDIYMVTSVRLSIILGATFHKAKFR
ncbi:MAG TPA: DUF6089 family protein [Cyclobacteriaceae bacterium]|nr:DUF6089 family protein [Cyclobacteriaceae bacterium]HRK54802.1 DUF6089 family protein [Cyclobacteriaceae bacterium]